MRNERGLLAALNFYNRLQQGTEREYTEVEYRLYSWGEIYPPFHGDREHSIAARYILQNYPFKLFSSSIPYDDPLPQKLCLTFKVPRATSVYQHETAKEFAAFLSLVTRRRVFIDRQMRYDGLPIEQKVGLYHQSHLQERQRLKEIEPSEIYQLLENLQAMDEHIAKGFILAIRLYHSAIDIMYTEPEFSYLFLVTCLEAISSVVHKDYTPNNEEEFLDSRFPRWGDLLNTSSQKADLMKLLLKNERFTFQKLLKFVEENVPERFWSETEDDAKPDYLLRLSGSGEGGLGQEHIRHSDITIQNSEKIEKENLKQVLQDIYKVRSQLIHSGIRLPPSILIGHVREIPVEEAIQIHNQETWIPPLLTFERLVSYSMVKFLRENI